MLHLLLQASFIFSNPVRHPDPAIQVSLTLLMPSATAEQDRRSWMKAPTSTAGGTSPLSPSRHRVYFTPQHTQESDHEACKEIKSGECSTFSSVPNHVCQMYSLLQTREAQVVVSSLASDKNVWDAVMNNEKVVQFFKNPSPAVAEIHEQLEESVKENESTEEFSPTVEAKETSGNSFLKTVKIKVSQMVSGISDFIKDFFVFATGNSSSSNDKSGSSATDNTNAVLGGSLFAVAVAAIMVILLKRA